MKEELLKRLPLRHLSMRRQAIRVISPHTSGPEAADYQVHCINIGLWIRVHGWAHVAAALKIRESTPTGFLGDLLSICAAADPSWNGNMPNVDQQVQSLLNEQQTSLTVYLLQARLALQAADMMKDLAMMLFESADDEAMVGADHA